VLVTAHCWLADEVDEKVLWRVYRGAWGEEPFVRVVKERSGLHRAPNPKLLAGTNHCDVGFTRDPHSRRVVVTAALDNLVKGAAGQAVQALNVRMGWDERLGLGFGGLYPL
jgi:N-acetyl-gamma-glutamyl-phosphate/LysW-gamma-L-alpha-aminoadipyl-6-phosphate reductase